MKKRLFSILLTLCMAICLVPITVFAEDGTGESLVSTCETVCTPEIPFETVSAQMNVEEKMELPSMRSISRMQISVA